VGVLISRANEAERHHARLYRGLARCRVWRHLRAVDGSRHAGADLSDQIRDSDGFVAVGAWPSRAKPTAEDAALIAALVSEQTRVALRALVDDRRPWQTAGQPETELVGRSLAEAETPLAAGGRAVGLAPASAEAATTGGAGALARRGGGIVTQRGFLLGLTAPQGGAFQRQTMGVMNEAIQDGIG